MFLFILVGHLATASRSPGRDPVPAPASATVSAPGPDPCGRSLIYIDECPFVR